MRLADHAQAGSVHPVQLHGGGGQSISEHVHEAGGRLRRRFDFSFEINTALIMPVQGQAADQAVGEVRETSSLLRLTSHRDGANPVC